MDESEALSFVLDPYAVAAFITYLILLVGIGIYASKFSSRGISEYFIAEGK